MAVQQIQIIDVTELSAGCACGEGEACACGQSCACGADGAC